MTSTKAAPGAGRRTSAVLLALAESRTLSAEEITHRTGIPVSAVYRHLSELIRAGLADTTQTRGRFSAGSITVQLAENYRREALSGGAVKSRLNKLSADTRELAAFLIPSGDRVLCVEAAEGTRRIRCSFEAGLSQPLTFGASAQALLAHLPQPRVEEVLTAHHVQGETRATLIAELKAARERGYVMTAGAVDEGVWGVSVPVLSPQGTLTGTVSTMVPDFRARRSQQSLLMLTQAAAHDISRLKEFHAWRP